MPVGHGGEGKGRWKEKRDIKTTCTPFHRLEGAVLQGRDEQWWLLMVVNNG
jgi:hypothetical protein